MENTYKLDKIYYGTVETRYGKELRLVMDVTDDFIRKLPITIDSFNDFEDERDCRDWEYFKDLFRNNTYYSYLRYTWGIVGRENELPRLPLNNKWVQTTRFCKLGSLSDFATIEERKNGTFSEEHLYELYSEYSKAFRSNESKIKQIQKEIDALQSQLLILQKRKEELEVNSRRLLK